MTELSLPVILWRDPRYLRTHRGMLVYRTPDGTGFAQMEADLAPKNLVIARHPELGWRLVHLRDDAVEIRPSDAIIAALRDAAQSTVIEQVTIEPMPGLDNVGLRRAGLYLCAGKTPELEFAAQRPLSWEMFEAARPRRLAYQLWRPAATMGGTQLMQLGLAGRLGKELDVINLRLHRPGNDRSDERPLVVWLHNDASDTFRWCADADSVGRVAAFVFVSYWQRQRFLANFPALPPERCHVIFNATDIDAPTRSWPTERPWRWRCAYTSAPDRGLSILLDAWEILDPPDAELHIWSSFRLWGQRFSDASYHPVFSHARRLPGVTYHGIRPNHEVRLALRDMHFLTYPATVDETSCIAVMEAMAAGLRVIATSRAALPETTGGFANLYASTTDREARVAAFARELANEFRNPWGGRPSMASAEQGYAREVYGWPRCIDAWRQLIARLTDRQAHTVSQTP
jgi:glycosyltransferase involved in cell wall biosynthesis